MAITPPPVSRPTPRRRPGGARGGGVRLALCALLAVPLAACATKRDVRDLTDELRAVSQRQEALLAEMRAAQAAHGDSLRALSRGQAELRAEFLRRIADIQEDLLLVHELAGTSQQNIAALRDQLERERRTIPGPGAFGDTEGGAGQAEDTYNQAMTQKQRGSFTAARMGFEEVVDRFPNHPLAPEARYQLADLLAQEGQIDEAIEKFLEIRTFYPNAERVPDALYQAGVLFQEKGDTAEARRHLQLVVNTWPESEAAQRARDALRDIG